MNLRYLVPALGVIAVSIPVATAADQAAAAPAISFEGWIDNKLTISSANNPQNDPATTKNEKSPEIGFANESSLKADIKVSDSIKGKINIWLSPGNDGTVATSGTGTSVIDVREAYLIAGINQDFSLQAGKYERPIGWISPEPTGLYTVNNSLIGYTSTYGNDVIGANVTWAHRDSPLVASVHITNGFFNTADSASVTPKSAFGAPASKTATRGNDDLGFGASLTFNIGPAVDDNFVGAFLADDPHVGLPDTYLITLPGALPALDQGGNALLVCVNGQYHINKSLLVAAEVVYLDIGDSSDAGATVSNTGGHRDQGLVLANWALPKGSASFPVSFTGEFQIMEAKGKYAGATTEKATEEAIAVLTNPTNSPHFGLNGELAFTQYTDGTTGFNKVNAIVLSIEAILSF